MKGIVAREMRLFLAAPINLGLALVTPAMYGLLFSMSLSNAIPVVSYESTTEGIMTAELFPYSVALLRGAEG